MQPTIQPLRGSAPARALRSSRIRIPRLGISRARTRRAPTRRRGLRQGLCRAGLCLALLALPCAAQEPPTAPLDREERGEVTGRAASVLEARYVLPEVGRRVADALREADARDAFGHSAEPEAFAAALSELVREVSGDRHLWVSFHPGEYPEPPPAPPTVEEREAWIRHLARTNFGLPRAEVLPGNVGYLEIRQFVTPELGGDAVAAAMGFLGHVDALVLDVRDSAGGSPDMVLLIASYLFGSRPIHLFDLYHRPEERTDQYRTLPHVAGPRLPGVPVYVLTRGSTFSAGEGLAYALKHLDRATVVGETTAGGAHPGRFHRLDGRFVMFVAEARATSPVTGGNWEGRGVTPDVEVDARNALERAHVLALERLAEDAEEPERAEELRRLAEEVRGSSSGSHPQTGRDATAPGGSARSAHRDPARSPGPSRGSTSR